MLSRAFRFGPWTLSLACSGADPAALDERYSSDPDAVIAEVLALEGAAREAAVIALLEAHPGQTGPLCAALPAGPARVRCDRFNARPHLWTRPETAPPQQDIPPGRAGGGPNNLRLLLPDALLQAWADTPPDPGTCTGQGMALCLETRALEAVLDGDLERAAAACRAFPRAEDQADCFFVAAEAVPPDAYAEGLRLCQGAGRFAPECHGHVLMRLATAGAEGPPGTEARDAAAAVAAARVQRTWEGLYPELADLAVDRFWAAYYSQVAGTTAAGLRDSATWTPAEAQPHRRGLLALFLADDLEGDGAAQPPLDRVQRANHWVGDRPEEQVFRAVSLPGLLDGRRPTVTDESVDLLLAWLEVQARLAAPDVERIAARAGHSAPVVRWTVARLLGRLDPHHAALHVLQGDSDAVVASAARLGAISGQLPPEPR